MKRPNLKIIVVVTSLLLALTLAAFTGLSQDAGKRGITIEPVARQADQGSAGLFVGVNEFEEPSVTPLRYAVNDAVAQANLFVNELKLIPAENCWMALSGSPVEGSPLELTLKNLTDQGVRVVPATKISVLRQLRLLSRIADRPEELLVVSLSAHGFEESGTPYALGRDGLLGPVLLPETGISLRAVEGLMEQSLAEKRLLILDACRERPTRGSRSLTPGATAEAFRQAFEDSVGRAVLASCDVGQSSFEDPRLGHGVFTYHLIEGLRGAADPSGEFLTLGGVSDYVSASVESWVRKNKPELPRPQWQRPWFKGPNDARQIPLAIARMEPAEKPALQPVLAEESKPLTVEDRKKMGMEYLSRATAFGLEDRVPGEFYQKVDIMLTLIEGPTLEALLDRLEILKENTAENRRAFVSAWQTSGKSANSDSSKTDTAAPNREIPSNTKSISFTTELPEPTPENPVPSLNPVINEEVREEIRDEKQDAVEWFAQNPMVIKPGEDFTIPDLGMKMIWVAPGEFRMGTKVSAVLSRDEYPHDVVITKGYWLSSTEVTVAQWEKIMNGQEVKGAEGELAKGGVSWEQAASFCAKLYGREFIEKRTPDGYLYTLPTEAEWEYACRAGTTNLWPIGGTAGVTGSLLGEYGWYQYSSGKNVNPVGKKKPNDWGFFDMLGNVREYCWDDYGTYPRNATDPVYVTSKSRSEKVARGGSYEDPASTCRSAARTRIKKDEVDGDHFGLRVALSAVPRPGQ